MNMFDEMQRNVDLYDKFKMAQKSILLFAIIKDKYIQRYKINELNDYKCRIIKEEFLYFDPTPKSEKIIKIEISSLHLQRIHLLISNEKMMRIIEILIKY